METKENSPKSTKEKWKIDRDIQNWLRNRQDTDWREQVNFWLDTVEFSRDDEFNVRGTWASLEELPNEQEVVKSIAYIERTQPKETWNWRLQPQGERYVEGERYVVWWCHMRKFIDDRPNFKDSANTDETVYNYPTYIYPTLEKWSYLFKTKWSHLLKTEDLSITAVQDMVLVNFAEWLLKLAADRQMFRSENIYNQEIPRIVISGSTKELKIGGAQGQGPNLDLKKEVGQILSRDASVVYIMQEGSKILSERGFDTRAWEKINKKYIWLLSEK
jgi:hypothetical protein